jgi:hypothetical protein
LGFEGYQLSDINDQETKQSGTGRLKASAGEKAKHNKERLFEPWRARDSRTGEIAAGEGAVRRCVPAG